MIYLYYILFVVFKGVIVLSHMFMHTWSSPVFMKSVDQKYLLDQSVK